MASRDVAIAEIDDCFRCSSDYGDSRGIVDFMGTKMRCLPLAAITAGALVAAALLPTAAQTAVILGQANDGDVYSIDTTTAGVTLFRDLSEFGAVNSPNSLAYDGSNLYRTQFPGTQFYVNNAQSGNVASTTASGDYFSGAYYYVSNNQDVWRINNPGLPGQTDTLLTNFSGTATYGDIAYDQSSGRLYASFNATFGYFSGANFGTFTSIATGVARFAGLAFAGGDLYGLDGGNGAVSNLYKINLDTGLGSLVGSTGRQFTDAATVPLPAAVWLFGSAFLGLCWLGRRSGMRGVGMLPKS